MNLPLVPLRDARDAPCWGAARGWGRDTEKEPRRAAKTSGDGRELQGHPGGLEWRRGLAGSGSPGNEPWTGEHLALQSKEVKKQSGGIPAPAGLLQGA